MQAADSRVCEHIRDVQNHVTAHCSAVVVAVYDTSCVVRVWESGDYALTTSNDKQQEDQGHHFYSHGDNLYHHR